MGDSTQEVVTMIPGKPHIHYVGDGRPPRYVYLNGRRVEATFADTKRGIVECFHNEDRPLNHYLLKVKGECRRQTLSGKVRVETRVD
jgi:hypothetical protein